MHVGTRACCEVTVGLRVEGRVGDDGESNASMILSRWDRVLRVPRKSYFKTKALSVLLIIGDWRILPCTTWVSPPSKLQSAGLTG